MSVLTLPVRPWLAVILQRRQLIRFAPHIPLRGMFVAVDRTHTMRTVPAHPRPLADALTRYEYGLIYATQQIHRKFNKSVNHTGIISA